MRICLIVSSKTVFLTPFLFAGSYILTGVPTVAKFTLLVFTSKLKDPSEPHKVNLLGIFYNLIPSGEDRLLTTSPLLFFDGL